MVAFAAVGGFVVLVRLAGTLQKHVFEPLVARDIRDAFKKARPAADRNQRLAMDAVTWSWDLANGLAYDDPVELIADLGAMGVKLSLLRAGVSLPSRLGLTLGTKGAVSAVETALRGVLALTQDPQAGARGLVEGLNAFVENMIPGFMDKDLVESGTKVSLDIATFAGQAGSFVSRAQSGDVLGSLMAGDKLVKAGLAVIGSLFDFVSEVQEALPEAPPVGRTITSAELRRFQEARREKPPSAPAVWKPGRDVIPLAEGFLEPWELRDIHGGFMGVISPVELRTSLMEFGHRLTGGSLRALKGRGTAATFPFG